MYTECQWPSVSLVAADGRILNALINARCSDLLVDLTGDISVISIIFFILTYLTYSQNTILIIVM